MLKLNCCGKKAMRARNFKTGKNSLSCVLIASNQKVKLRLQSFYGNISFVFRFQSPSFDGYLENDAVDSGKSFFYSGAPRARGAPLLRKIDLIHDIRHLCTRIRTDEINVMSRGFSVCKQAIKSAK